MNIQPGPGKKYPYVKKGENTVFGQFVVCVVLVGNNLISVALCCINLKEMKS